MADSPLTIRSLTARAVIAPLARPLRTASGEIPAAPLLLIDIASDQGVMGRAYLFGYTRVTLRALKALTEDLAPLLIGKPLAPQDRAADCERAFRLLGRQGLLGMALSGIDMALWDALGRALNQPVVALLGGSTRAGDTAITSETVIAEDLTMDSLQVMDLMMELEDRFDVSIPLNLVPEIATVGQLADTIYASKTGA